MFTHVIHLTYIATAKRQKFFEALYYKYLSSSIHNLNNFTHQASKHIQFNDFGRLRLAAAIYYIRRRFRFKDVILINYKNNIS